MSPQQSQRLYMDNSATFPPAESKTLTVGTLPTCDPANSFGLGNDSSRRGPLPQFQRKYRFRVPPFSNSRAVLYCSQGKEDKDVSRPSAQKQEL